MRLQKKRCYSMMKKLLESRMRKKPHCRRENFHSVFGKTQHPAEGNKEEANVYDKLF